MRQTDTAFESDRFHATEAVRRALALGLFSLVFLSTVAAASAFHSRSADRAARAGQGYLGINFHDVTGEQVAVLKLKDAQGEEVILVDHDGPACEAGIREHDVLMQINGEPIDGEDHLRRLLHDLPPGRQVNFVISRDGLQQTITVQLADRAATEKKAWEKHKTVPDPYAADNAPADPPRRGISLFGSSAPNASDLPRHGLPVMDILNPSYTGAVLELLSPQLADFFGAQIGLLVRAVDPDSPAGTAGMRAGDVVVKINSFPVATAADWTRIVHENRGRPLFLVVLRDKKEQFLTLTPDTKKRSSIPPPTIPADVGMLALPGPVI